MSHFTCLIITKDQQDPEELLTPFDENTRVDEYEEDCYCARHELNMKVRETLEKEFGGTFDEVLRQKYHAITPELRIAWKDFIAPWQKRETELEAELKPTIKPKESCEDCHGTGKSKTTYNPQSKWDWYELGGRWLGNFMLKKGKKGALGRAGVGDNKPDKGYTADQAKFGDIDWEAMKAEKIAKRTKLWDEAHAKLKKGEIKHDDLDWKYGIESGQTKEQYVGTGEFTPFSIITSDGVWHEKGDMGWWGMVSDEKKPEDWEAMCRAILEKCEPTDTLSVYDLHI